MGPSTPTHGALKNLCNMGLTKIENLRKSGAITAQEAARRIAQHNAAKMSKQPKQKKPQTQRRVKQVKVLATPTPPKGGVGPRTSLINNTGNRAQRRSDPSMDYLCTLMDPERCIARLPDSEPRRTAVIRTIRNVQIPISLDAANKGKFSFAVQPKFGATADISQYQVTAVNGAAITAAGLDWDTVDWSNGSYYMSTLDQGGDLRIDPDTVFLTSNFPSFQATSFSNATADLARNTLVSGILTNQTQSSDNTDPSIKFYSPGNVGPYLGLSGGIVVLPFGDWQISLAVKFQCNPLPANGFEAINFNASANQVAYIGIQQQQTLVPNTNTTYVVSCTAQVSSSPGHNRVAFCLDDSQSGLTNAVADANVSQVSASYITLTPANFNSTNNYSDGGCVEEVRPVAQSVFVTYMGSTLNNGGEVAIAYVPNKALTNNYFQTNNASQIGQLQQYDRVAAMPGAYDGRLEDGCYCIWAPYTSNDFDLVSPSVMNAYPYPGIVCSGVFTPDNVTNPYGYAIRLRICTVYEFVTMTTCFETIPVFGSQAMIDMALDAVKRHNFASANKEHKNFIRKVIDWYKSNSMWVNPLISGAATMLV